MEKSKDTLSMRLARRLRAARGELTLVQFARKLGISKSSLQRMEMGQQNVTLETLDVLCSRFKCDVGGLFDSTQPVESAKPPKSQEGELKDTSLIDRIKKLTIIAMVSDDEFMETLVLKGGNALDLIYRLAHRSSVDLDFSMAGAFEPGSLEAVRARIEQALTATFVQAGFRVFDVRMREKPAAVSPELRDFWGGYGVEFKIIREELASKVKGDLEAMRRQAEETGPEHRRTCLIDISKHEFCGVKREETLDGHTLYVYPPGLIALEKLRAICQQSPEYRSKVMKHFASRARDFFDIHLILERFQPDLASPENLDLLRSVFEAKRVPLHLLGEIPAMREAHREGHASLKDSILPGVALRPYDFYFDEVAALARSLFKALGNP